MEDANSPAVNVALELAGREVLVSFVDGSTKKGVYCLEDKTTVSFITGKERWLAYKSAIKYITLGKSKATEQDVIKYVQDERDKQAAYVAGGMAALQTAQRPVSTP